MHNNTETRGQSNMTKSRIAATLGSQLLSSFNIEMIGFTHATLCWRGTGYVPVSVCLCHKSVLCCLFRNVWTERAGFWQGCVLRLILNCFARK